MKKTLFTIFLLAAIWSCSEEDKGPQMGCSIGIRVGEEDLGYQLLRCCTNEQHLAGNNVQAGGISYFANYKQWKWEAVSDCSACDKYKK